MIRSFSVWQNYTSKTVLYALKSKNRRVWETIEKRVTVVKTRRDERVSKEGCRVNIQ